MQTYVITAFIAVSLVVASFILSSIENSRYSRSKFSIKALTQNPILSFFVRHFKPSANSKSEKKILNNIYQSFIRLSIDEFYSIKFLAVFLLIVLTSSVVFTNYFLARSEIIRGSSQKNTKYMMEVSDGKSGEEIGLTSVQHEVVYKIVNSKLKYKTISQMQYSDAVYQAANLISMDGRFSGYDYYTLSIDAINKVVEVHNLLGPKQLLAVLIAAMIGFMVPNLVIIILGKIRYRKFDREVQDLENITIVVGGLPNITVKQIIETLVKSSKVFKPLLEEFYSLYAVNRDRAYEFIFGSELNRDMERLVNTLRQAEESDREFAIRGLRDRRDSRKEYKKLSNEVSIERRDTICLIGYFVVLVMLLVLLLGPWLSSTSLLDGLNYL